MDCLSTEITKVTSMQLFKNERIEWMGKCILNLEQTVGLIGHWAYLDLN